MTDGSAPAEVGEAVAFPGQGVNPVDAVRVIAEHAGHPLVTHLAALTGHAEWRPEDLGDTRLAQPAIVAAGLLTVADEGLTPVPGGLAVGHSLGEITALAFAGVLRPTDALDLVAARAELGHAAHQERPGRMVASLKLEATTVEWVRRVALARAGGVLELAVVNGAKQFVLSGDAATADLAMDLIAEAGGVPRRLGIGGAFHSPLLVDAVEAFAARVRTLDLAEPTVPVVLSTSSAVIERADDVADLLARALVMPVQWVRAMEAVRERGFTHAVDVGPGRTLANLAEFTPVLTFRALAEA